MATISPSYSHELLCAACHVVCELTFSPKEHGLYFHCQNCDTYRLVEPSNTSIRHLFETSNSTTGTTSSIAAADDKPVTSAAAFNRCCPRSVLLDDALPLANALCYQSPTTCLSVAMDTGFDTLYGDLQLHVVRISRLDATAEHGHDEFQTLYEYLHTTLICPVAAYQYRTSSALFFFQQDHDQKDILRLFDEYKARSGAQSKLKVEYYGCVATASLTHRLKYEWRLYTPAVISILVNKELRSFTNYCTACECEVCIYAPETASANC